MRGQTSISAIDTLVHSFTLVGTLKVCAQGAHMFSSDDHTDFVRRLETIDVLSALLEHAGITQNDLKNTVFDGSARTEEPLDSV